MTEHDVTRLPVVARADCALLDLVTPAPVASGAAPGPTRVGVPEADPAASNPTIIDHGSPNCSR